MTDLDQLGVLDSTVPPCFITYSFLTPQSIIQLTASLDSLLKGPYAPLAQTLRCSPTTGRWSLSGPPNAIKIEQGPDLSDKGEFWRLPASEQPSGIDMVPKNWPYPGEDGVLACGPLTLTAFPVVGGRVALVLSIHHCILDGRAFFEFAQQLLLGKSLNVIWSRSTFQLALKPGSTSAEEVGFVFPPKDQANTPLEFMPMMTPEQMKALMPPASSVEYSIPINALREALAAPQLTRNDIVCACVLSAFAQANDLPDDSIATVAVPVDIRPPGMLYAGNASVYAFVQQPAGKIREWSLVEVAQLVHASVQRSKQVGRSACEELDLLPNLGRVSTMFLTAMNSGGAGISNWSHFAIDGFAPVGDPAMPGTPVMPGVVLLTKGAEGSIIASMGIGKGKEDALRSALDHLIHRD